MSAATVFEVVADPRRRRLLDLLHRDEHTVTDLVERTGQAQPAVSKHLRVLREAGLVQVRVDGPRRWYRLDPAPLAEVDAWLTPFRRRWSRSLDALEQHLDAGGGPA